MVSAVVLLVTIVALFVALDVQTDASGDTRSSSTAASLAEQDQERLRSFSVPALVGRNEVQTKVVAGTSYKVESAAEWVSDATSAADSCTSTGQEAQYLRLTSTVTAPADGPSTPAPIRLRSLMAAPVGRGSLTVKVTGGAGQAVQGATASIAGPAAASGSTNSLGCAVFPLLPAGTYNASVTAGGFVDESGSATAKDTGTVSPGTSNITTLTYDRAGRVDVSFDTQVGAAISPGKASFLSVANAGVPSSSCATRSGTGVRLFCGAGAPQTTIAATGLFPFADAYTIYSGACPSANPTRYDPNYFATPGRGSLVVGPGSSAAVTVREPALRLRLTTASANVPVHVRAVSTDPTCSEAFDWDVTTDATKSVTLPDPGVPFGRYSVCADALVSGTRRRETITSVDLVDRAGSAQQTIDLSTTAVPAGTTAATGACP